MALHALLTVPVALHWCTATCILHAPGCAASAALIYFACMTKETLDHEAYQAIDVLSDCSRQLDETSQERACLLAEPWPQHPGKHGLKGISVALLVSVSADV